MEEVAAGPRVPAYAIESVDNVLRLLMMLRRDGGLRVSAAARELGVARSTAHRLIAMLVFREFVVQRPDRSYAPGPALAVLGGDAHVGVLSGLALPRLERLVELTGETASLMIRSGTDIRFVESLASPRALSVAATVGQSLPAARTSGGKALLAELANGEVRELYGASDVGRLLSQLSATRRLGYGVNVEESRPGVMAVAVCVRGVDGRPVGALTLAVPTVRRTHVRMRDFVPLLKSAAEEIRRDLGASGRPQGSGGPVITGW